MHNKRLAAALALLLATTSLQAAEIREVQLRSQDGKEVIEDVLQNNIRSKTGSEFNARILSDDIRRLYETNFFKNVEAKFDQEKGVLTFIVTRKPLVTQVSYEGCRDDEVDTEDVKDAIKHPQNVPVSDTLIAEDKNAIRKLYEEDGFFGVRIEAQIRELGEGKVSLVYVIDEGKALQIDAIRIHGNTVFSDDQIRGMIKTTPSFFRYLWDTGFYNEIVFKADRELLARVYKDLGYLDFKIKRVTESVDEDNYLTLDLYVEEGRPYTVGDVKFSGQAIYTQEDIQRLIAMKSGFPYTKAIEQADTERILRLYNNDGYLESVCRAEYILRPDTHVVDVEYKIAEGRRYHIRDVNIRNNYDVQEHVIRREMNIHPDDLGNQFLVDKSKKRLMGMGYFKNVEITPVDTEVEGKKDLQVKVEENNTGRVLLGAGFSSAESFVFTAGYGESNFDLLGGWPFKGAGEHFRADLRLGNETQNASVSWTDPWFLDQPLALSTTLYHSTRFYENYDQTNTGYEVSIAKQWDDFPLWTVKHGHRLEYVSVSDMDTDVSQELKDEETNDLVSAYIFSIYKDTRNDTRRPTEGRVMGFTAELQSALLLSENEQAKFRTWWTEYFELFDDSALKLHAEFNTGVGDMPIYERYFGGGIGRIRGYRERELGPVDRNGDALGGNSAIYTSMEFDTPLNSYFHGVWFVDAGNVWANSFDFADPFDFSVTTGPGLRILLPIATVELYYGIPIVDNAEKSSSGRLHFAMGYNF